MLGSPPGEKPKREYDSPNTCHMQKNRAVLLFSPVSGSNVFSMDAAVGMESLRRWREAHSVTQAQLAAEVAVHPSAISKLEHGAMAPDVITLYRLACITEIPVMNLLREAVGTAAEMQPPARQCSERRKKRPASPRRTGPAA